MSLQFITVPTKTLAQSISSSSTTFKLNDILNWAGVALTAADFGTQAFAVLRNDANTVMEIIEFDPSTIASASITIVRRGLKFNATTITTTDSTLQLDWVKNETLVEIGTNAPHIYQWLKNYIDSGLVSGAPDASTTVKGVVEQATQAEVNSGASSGGTTAPLFVSPDKLATWLATQTGLIPPSGSITMYAGSSAPTNWLLCDGSLVSRATYASLFTAISTNYGSGDGSTTFGLPDFRSRVPVGKGAGTFTSTFANTDVNTGTDVVTVTSNQSLFTGTTVVLTTVGTPPTGLTSGNTYYVIRTSATTIQLASSLANAIAGTQIDITGAGSGTNTLTVTYSTYALNDKGGEEAHALTIAELAAHTHTYQSGVSSGGAGTAVHNSNNADSGTTNSTGGSTAHENRQPYLAVNYIIKT